MAASAELAKVCSPVDLYYTDSKNCLKQAIPTTYNTRFRQNFNNLGAGQNNLYIPANSGIKHVVLVFGYNAAALAAQNGANALPRGWGYDAIESISWRVAGSSQYFLTGAQLLARNLRMVRTQSQAENLLSLGGSEAKVAADFTDDLFAYIPISVLSTPSCDALEPPVASDLLGQAIQIQVTLKDPSAFWKVNTAAAVPAALPSVFTTGYFQVEQLEMDDRGMSMASRVDLNTHTYVQALHSFDQQELTANVSGVTAPTQVTFSGLMAGQVRAIQVYLTSNTDTANPTLFYAPKSVKLTYAGTVYSDYADGASRVWNLIDGTKPSMVSHSALALSAPGPGSTWVSAPVQSEYAILPFSQPIGSDYEADIEVAGKSISNGSITLEILPPDAGSYKIHVVPILNAALAYSRGSCAVLIG